MTKARMTRQMILQNSFGLIYRKGFKTTSIDDILATTHLTKGAFFYHFKNKDEMGLAMINEIMHAGVKKKLLIHIQGKKNAKSAIYEMMKKLLYDTDFFDFRYGCPTVNLVDEMSPLNEDFNKALKKVMAEWHDAIVSCIANDKKLLEESPDLDPKAIARFVMSGYAGARNMGKIFGMESYSDYLKELKKYLHHI